ncbi:unnamed protein product [Natator depressus]
MGQEPPVFEPGVPDPQPCGHQFLPGAQIWVGLGATWVGSAHPCHCSSCLVLALLQRCVFLLYIFLLPVNTTSHTEPVSSVASQRLKSFYQDTEQLRKSFPLALSGLLCKWMIDICACCSPSQLGVICRFHKHTLHSIIQVINENIK